MKHLKNRSLVNKNAHANLNIDVKASHKFHDVCLGGWG